MTADRRSPSRLPIRGVLGIALTGAGLALLLSFRTPPAPGSDLALGVPEQALATDELMRTAAPTTAVEAATRATLIGAPIEIRWGNVQVSVTVEADRIVGVETLQVPNGDRRSQRISESAEPVLREQAIERGSADIDVVSGATYTSLAYAYSLQSALDQLGA